MNKIYCDLCDKEIIDNNFVVQSILVNYNFEDSVESDICKECWEKEEKIVRGKK